jgi:hypothetical protein
MSRKMFLLASGSEAAGPLEAWRADYARGRREVAAFAQEIGAVSMSSFRFEKPMAFGFRGNPPEGWTKPKAKGISVPKKANAEMRARMEAIFWPESFDAVVQRSFGFPSGFSFTREDGREQTKWLSIGVNRYDAAWPKDGPIILMAPDAQAEADAVLASHPEAKITWIPEGSGPEIPAGFERRTEAEVELIFAEAKVAAERRARAVAADEAPAP